jgi:putative membrane protein
MIRLLIARWAFNVGALFVAAVILDGVSYGDKAWVLIVAGLVFGIVNTFVKPIVTLLALPLIVLTLGLAYFGVNMLMLYMTHWIVDDFEVGGFWSVVAATIIVWLVNTILTATVGRELER